MATVGKRLWEAMLRAGNYRCALCKRGWSEVTLTADHIRPRSKGGTNDPANLRILCKGCNERKGARWE